MGNGDQSANRLSYSFSQLFCTVTGKRGTDQCLLRSAIPGKIGWIYAERERIVLHFTVLEIFNGRVQFPSGAVKGDRASHWKRFNIQILNNVTVFTISVSNDRGLSLSLRTKKITFRFCENIVVPCCYEIVVVLFCFR